MQVPAHDNFLPTTWASLPLQRAVCCTQPTFFGLKRSRVEEVKKCTWRAGREQAGNKSLFWLSGWNFSWDSSMKNTFFFFKVLLKFQIFFLLFSLPAYYNIFDAFLFLSFYINLSESKFELWSCERNICIVTPLNLTVFEKWVRNMVLMSIFWDIFPKQITIDVSPFILCGFGFFFLSDYSFSLKQMHGNRYDPSHKIIPATHQYHPIYCQGTMQQSHSCAAWGRGQNPAFL